MWTSKLRRPRAETAIAWAAAAVGLLSVVSALTPEMADRTHLVQAALPPGVPHAARLAAIAFGLALVWLSRGLASRRRRAWQLAVALVVFTAAAHLAKGLDVEEASAGLVLLGLLLAYRRRYDVPGDPATRRPALALALGLAAAFALPGAIELAWLHLPDRLDDFVDVSAALLAYAALYLWLRPLGERVLQSVEERREVRTALERHGDDSLDFFALRRDKSWFFSASRRSFLAYRVVGGAALVSGEPVGPAEELGPLVEEFRRLCRVRGWRLAVLNVRDDSLPFFHSLGLRSVKLGDEAVIRPETFSLEGRPIRKVRQSVTRLHRAGYRVDVLRAGEVGDDLRAELERVSDEWRGNAPERGFTMAMDSLFAEPDTLLAVASDAGRARRRVHPPRLLARGRRPLAVGDAPQPGDPERPDGVPRRGDRRVGARGGRARDLAQLLHLHRPAARRPRALADRPDGAVRAAAARRAVPDRAHARVQPQVLPGVAVAPRLLRAARRRARRRARLPPRRVAADPAGALDAPARARPRLAVSS